MMNSSIGFKIKKLREQKEISQEDLAFQLEVSQSYLSKIENGAIEKLDFIFMQKISDFFKVEPRYFLEGDTIVNNNIEKSTNSSVGNIGDTTINSNTDQNLLENVISNQHHINQLMEMQNRLIEKLLKN
ncbi:helix-turn-helix domain-containing protein [Chryseobacterium hagamense]|uniref:HTH cro/C1-type domain-containing protein n=1 Tax=Chryseobacterium hagamense TaxID=395935 RepID=A0A511YMJ5_9FLAO|nr:helix-turn-helix transcriptional regulator [Chryseobacterium hagamense]GEN76408.1 hypothetical protein CHA01nite_21480 [Chryseobacterium hagamense]